VFFFVILSDIAGWYINTNRIL